MKFIEKQAAIDLIGHELRCGATVDQCGLETALELLCELPPADVRPVVRGCWVYNEEDGHYYCSECGGVSPMDDQNGDECDCPNWCLYCGAYMRGGDYDG